MVRVRPTKRCTVFKHILVDRTVDLRISETRPSFAMKGELFNQAETDGLFVFEPRGCRLTFRVQNDAAECEMSKSEVTSF
jgi:hypothetical protein